MAIKYECDICSTLFSGAESPDPPEYSTSYPVYHMGSEEPLWKHQTVHVCADCIEPLSRVIYERLDAAAVLQGLIAMCGGPTSGPGFLQDMVAEAKHRKGK